MPSDRSGTGVLLIGCGPTAHSALDSLAERFPVLGVVRDLDRGDTDGDPVRRRAAELGISVTADTSITGIERLITRARPTCVVVSSYNRILPPRVLAGRRFVNVHYAPLPRYRGRATVSWAMINAEPGTAISIHVLTPDLDGGNILFQQGVPFESEDTITKIYNRLNTLQRLHLGDAVARHLAGDDGRPQDGSQATYTCSRLPQDGEIVWSQPTRRIHDLIRALAAPYPGGLTFLGGLPIRVWRADLVPNPPRYEGRVPGRVVNVARQHGWVDVLTGDGVLRVHEVEVAGDGPRPAAEVITSVRCTLGLHAFDLLDRIRALEAAVAELSRVGGRALSTQAV
ncbi:methionyl-tRNA formyltransferase [bacterium]|nr:methionyl-tRNA formyltransferase [bacterium]